MVQTLQVCFSWFTLPCTYIFLTLLQRKLQDSRKHYFSNELNRKLPIDFFLFFVKLARYHEITDIGKKY